MSLTTVTETFGVLKLNPNTTNRVHDIFSKNAIRVMSSEIRKVYTKLEEGFIPSVRKEFILA